MTHTPQALPAIGISRRKRVIGAAFEFVASQKLSPELKRAVLGPNLGNTRSKRPAFLRLYFALNAKKFPVSDISRNIAEQQSKQRALNRQKRTIAHIERHTMPAYLKEQPETSPERQSWINMRITAARARKAHRTLAA